MELDNESYECADERDYANFSYGCKSERVLLGLKERLRNEIENAPQLGLKSVAHNSYLAAIEDVLAIIEKLEDTK